MKLPVTIDPRYHDAVVFGLDGALIDDTSLFEATVALARKCHGSGVATAAHAAGPHCRDVLKAAGVDDLFDVCIDSLEAARRLGVSPQRAVVVEDSDAGVSAGQAGGFELVIGVDRTGDADTLLRCGADVVLDNLADIAVRAGDKRISELPNALESYGQLVGVTRARQSMLFLDYDGTLSPIVPDPAAARLVDGAAEALELVSAVCPVAVLSGRDLADIRDRVGIQGIWYAGSHGFELTGPDGTYHQNDAAAAVVPVLQRAAGELRETLAHIPGVRVEHKRFAVAVHYREVAPEHVGEIVAATHRLGQRDDLRVTSGRMLVELRPDIDWDKGTTLAWILDRIDPSRFPAPDLHRRRPHRRRRF